MPYTVKSGDSLSRIAAANNVSLAELIAANPQITDPNLIRPGQVLSLPGETSTPTTTSEPSGNPDLDAIRAEYERIFGEPPPATLTTVSTIRQIIRDAQVSGTIDDAPVETGRGAIIPNGARVVIIENPEGSDANRLYHLVYDWRGVELVFEIGDAARFIELFGQKVEDTFANISVVSQSQFDNQDFVQAGSVDEILGSTESLGSQIEREVRALGLEDLPPWLAASSESLALVAEATASGWSSGRLWQELSGTQAFTDRFGGALDRYLQGGTTIQQAVSQLQADEQNLKRRLQFLAPPDSLTTDTLQAILSQGWTPDSAARVMEQASILSDTAALAQANQIMEASGLPSLDDVGFINALNGFGPPEVVEALNTVAASVALEEAGLDDVDIDLLMEVVDTSDRLLTAESFQELTQELSFNFARFGSELDREKLGLSRENVIAGLFGEEFDGTTPGEVLNLLARFERDRRAAAQGISGPAAGVDRRGRLVVQGLGGL